MYIALAYWFLSTFQTSKPQQLLLYLEWGLYKKTRPGSIWHQYTKTFLMIYLHWFYHTILMPFWIGRVSNMHNSAWLKRWGYFVHDFRRATYNNARFSQQYCSLKKQLVYSRWTLTIARSQRHCLYYTLLLFRYASNNNAHVNCQVFVCAQNTHWSVNRLGRLDGWRVGLGDWLVYCMGSAWSSGVTFGLKSSVSS